MRSWVWHFVGVVAIETPEFLTFWTTAFDNILERLYISKK